MYEYKKQSDSIAKYAQLGYQLNDSAYLLSEMDNVQRLQSTYQYNRNKLLAEKKSTEVERLKVSVLLILLLVIIALWFFSRKYVVLKKYALDYRLSHADITTRLKELASHNPPLSPNYDDWKALRNLVLKEIPSFLAELTPADYSLSDFEVDICLLIRVKISPSDIAKLKNCSPAHVTNTRKRLLNKIYGRQGKAEDFDDEIGKIGFSKRS